MPGSLQDATPAALQVLRDFYDARGGMLESFYFYDPYETVTKSSYDPTGQALAGRYTRLVYTTDPSYGALPRSHSGHLSVVQSRSSAGTSSIFDATASTCARTFPAAFFTAPPEIIVVLDAYAP